MGAMMLDLWSRWSPELETQFGLCGDSQPHIDMLPEIISMSVAPGNPSPSGLRTSMLMTLK